MKPTLRGIDERRLRIAGLAIDVVAVLACAAWAARLSAGMDVSWDLLAYHHYYSWLFVNGDMGQADPEPYVNRYQNPLAELPWYLLDQVMSPRTATATIAAIAGLNLVLIRRVTMVLLPTHVTGLRRLALGLASVVLAAVGATFSMELGMSAADVIVSIPMLGSLLLVLRFAMAPESSRGQRWLLVVAGVLAGCALGAKLTMMPYVVAMAACVVYLCVVARTGWPLVRFSLGGGSGPARPTSTGRSVCRVSVGSSRARPLPRPG